MRKQSTLIQTADASLRVTRESLGAKVTERLRLLIRRGDLAPGSRLVENELAQLVGVSRGPVREALRNLEREGLVVNVPDKGAVVTEWNLDDLLDLYDVRAPLEIKAAMLVAERAAASCGAALDDVLARWEPAARANDREQCAELDFEFHGLIWQHTNNRFLAAALERCIHPLQTVFYLNATRYDDLTEVLALHRRLGDAVAAGDVARTQGAMEAHMQNSLEKARRHSKKPQPEDND